jgi:hypothetical protein
MTEDDDIIMSGLAALARHAPAPDRLAAEVVVTKSDLAKAGGTKSDLFNAMIVRQACAGNDVASARETVELLKQIAPRDAREGLMARRLIALDALAMETMALARAAGHPALRDAYVAQAMALSRAATALDEAIERRRIGKPEQRIVVQHIHGGQVVGMVSRGEAAQ